MRLRGAAQPAIDTDAARLSYRTALADEIGKRLATAMSAGHIPDQDIKIAAPALVGAITEGLVGPLAADARDEAPMRDAVQTLTLFALRAVGVTDARARGLVVQSQMPARVDKS